MRRRDIEITDMKEMRYVLDTADVIHIGMHDGDDIYVLPMNYGYTLENGELTFYVHGSLEGKKLDLIRECPNVGFELDCDHQLIEGRLPCQYGYGYASIIGKGHMEIVEDPKEKMQALTILMACLSGKNFEFNERLVSIVSVMKLTVSEFAGKRRPVKESEKARVAGSMPDTDTNEKWREL